MAENYVYGVNLPASQLKPVLADMQRNQQGVSTWNQLLGATSLGYQKQQSALTQQYGEAINEAYKAHLGTNQNIANLGLSEEQRANQFGLSLADLENTYNKYLSSYNETATELATKYAEGISAIDNTLTQEAENYSKLLNSAYTYLSEELYPATLSDEKGNIIGNYLDKSILNKYIDKDGKLMSANDVYTKLFNLEGQLTDEGREFFDAIYNAKDLAGYQTNFNKEIFDTRSFDKWLSDTDAELRNFFASADPYNFNFAGTRKGTLQQMLGMESTDNTYNQGQYYNEEKFNNAVKNIENTMATAIKSNNTVYTKGYKAPTSVRDFDNAMTADFSKGTKSTKASYGEVYNNVKDMLGWKNVRENKAAVKGIIGGEQQYLTDYYSYASAEYNAIKNEFKLVMGKNFNKFWDTYGNEIDDYMKTLSINYTKINNTLNDVNNSFTWSPGSLSQNNMNRLQAVFNDITSLKTKTDKVFDNIYNAANNYNI